MTSKKTSAGVIGAGISGLTVAYALQKRGISVSVYEKESDAGGAIRTVRKDGWLVEEGPNTLMVKSEKVWNLLGELSLGKEVIEANSRARRRFIVKNGNPVPLPTSPGAFLNTPLLSPGAKLRLLKEPFAASSEKDDESIASFILRRLGREPLDYGVNPFVAGVYGGDPAKLSIKHTFSTFWEKEQQYGSLLKGAVSNRKSRKKKHSPVPVKKSLISFSGGLRMLTDALAGALKTPVRTSCEIESAKRINDRWRVSGVHNHQSFQADHELLISALPAHALPSIFEPALFNQLSDIPYVPLSVIALGFKNEQIKHPLDGFGMLVPEIENRTPLGMLFSSTLFPGRAPRGHQLLTCFIGGARQPHLAHKSTSELLEQLLPELNDLLDVKGAPAFTRHSFWKRAIPQYIVGYDRYLSAMTAIEEQHPGLLLSGNYRRGVSVPDCILAGFETAEKAERMVV